jgi:cell division protein ZapA
MEEKLSIKINIGDKYYPLRIERSEEEMIRKAAKAINDKLNQYKGKYAERDMVDLLAMTALQFTKKYYEKAEAADTDQLNAEIKQINTDIEEYINQR